jgi:beta-phosphoglucomutase-like phosphatase (HAD superfamily)
LEDAMLELRGFGEIQAVGLDLDGTLILTEDLNVEAALVTCREAGLRLPKDLKKLVIGNTNAAIFIEILRQAGQQARPGLIDTLAARKRQYFAENIHKARAVRGGVEFVRATKGHALSGLVTAASDQSMSAALLRLGVEREEFNLLLPADALCRGRQPKPHRDHWLEAARLLGMLLRLRQMLAVEDSLKGVASAVGAGLTVCGITTTCSARTLVRAGAHFTVASFAELADLLGLTL